MLRLGMIFALLFCTVSHVQAKVSSKPHPLNLKLLAPLIIDHIESVQLDSTASQTEKAPLNLSAQQAHSAQKFQHIKQYINHLKQYSKLQVTNEFAITVGQVKSSPLGADQQALVETPDIFLPRLHQLEDSSVKGYGLKFKLDL